MMDDIARYNRERWEELAKTGVQYSRPWLDLTKENALERVDPQGKMGDPRGKDVLCLAGGGGQQTAAFAMLGANVTVLDLCETQLSRDVEAAEHYGFEITTIQGDMRDLSCFGDDTFDIVWHAHSLSFIPDPQEIFKGASRILRLGGLYRLSCWNPMASFVDDQSWTGKGYLIHEPYADGEVVGHDLSWGVTDFDGQERTVEGPREFRHTLQTIVNGLLEENLSILGLWEHPDGNTPDPKPGTWQHLQTIMPAWMTVLTQLRGG